MTDWEAKLAVETDDALKVRRRNADRVAREKAGTPRGDEAERLLALIEAEFDRRHLPGMMKSFLEKFPEGFRDPLHLEQERNYKLEASRFCRAELAPSAFAQVREGGASDELVARVRKLVQMTNLIQGGFEKPKLLDAISDPKYTRSFLAALDNLLHGAGSSSDRLEDFTAVLADMGLRKWTYATYFLFLSDPANAMYVKPEGLKRALEITRYKLEYDSAPSGALYSEILAFADWLNTKLVQEKNPALHPEDMIDVQSFIWHMAPTGKFSETAMGH
jgi:hypothetical protein